MIMIIMHGNVTHASLAYVPHIQVASNLLLTLKTAIGKTLCRLGLPILLA